MTKLNVKYFKVFRNLYFNFCIQLIETNFTIQIMNSIINKYYYYIKTYKYYIILITNL